MKNRKTAPKISYEPEADVLVWEMSKRPIDFAREVDNFVVHFAKDQTPVLIEILEASKFVKKTGNLLSRRSNLLVKPLVTVN